MKVLVPTFLATFFFQFSDCSAGWEPISAVVGPGYQYLKRPDDRRVLVQRRDTMAGHNDQEQRLELMKTEEYQDASGDAGSSAENEVETSYEPSFEILTKPRLDLSGEFPFSEKLRLELDDGEFPFSDGLRMEHEMSREEEHGRQRPDDQRRRAEELTGRERQARIVLGPRYEQPQRQVMHSYEDEYSARPEMADNYETRGPVRRERNLPKKLRFQHNFEEIMGDEMTKDLRSTSHVFYDPLPLGPSERAADYDYVNKFQPPPGGRPQESFPAHTEPPIYRNSERPRQPFSSDPEFHREPHPPRFSSYQPTGQPEGDSGLQLTPPEASVDPYSRPPTRKYPANLHKPKKRGPGRRGLTKRPKRKYQPPSQDNWTPITEAVHSQEIYNPPTSEHFLPTPKYPSAPQFSQTPQQFFPVKEQYSSYDSDSPPLAFSPDSVGLISQVPPPSPAETYPLRPKRNNFGGPPPGHKRNGEFQTTQLGKSSYISVWVPN